MTDLPPLDCHAHLSVSVTDAQLSKLGQALIFGMTRDLDEAFDATKRWDRHVLWGCGMHPANVAKGAAFSAERFSRLARQFAVVGEVGLDRRAGNPARQAEIFESILALVHEQPLLVSVHSAGCSAEIVASIEASPVRKGLILHWFGGSPRAVDALLELGCYFSVNQAMRPEVIDAIPLDRMLPETDFPAPRRRTGQYPGDTSSLEQELAERMSCSPTELRRHFYKNLRRISLETGAIDRMPAHVVDELLTVV